MDRGRPADLVRLWRFLQAGLANTLFGYALYAAFVAVGLQMYGAQIVCQLIGVSFAWVTYSRHVFADARGSRRRFVLAYAVHYGVAAGTLALVHRAWPSPYGAGFIAIVVAAAFNFLVLRNFVFAAPFSETRHANCA